MVASSPSLPRNLKRTTLITSAIFGGPPTDSPTVSQGSVFHYKDAACSFTQRLTENAAPLLLPDECKPVPSSDILSMSINSLPDCPNYGQPLLVLYDGADCQSVNADPAEVGVVGACQTLKSKSNSGGGVSTAVEIKSAKWTIILARVAVSVISASGNSTVTLSTPTASLKPAGTTCAPSLAGAPVALVPGPKRMDISDPSSLSPDDARDNREENAVPGSSFETRPRSNLQQLDIGRQQQDSSAQQPDPGGHRRSRPGPQRIQKKTSL
ncbi:hypothetical protein QBC47DRAFT_417371 [Echria macrotheca]|uniref:Uncharacterized protein n=1 Tax=Echria macrotheca TaxID=438768 RepID=A0AAJ0B4C7_9PEZI|nr:hypothetical protein QBC47DRAFT_417371 [Echria macrotheca]